MEKEFVPYTEALALKELGFDEDCLYDYFAFNNLNQTLEDDIKPMLTQEDVDNYCVENKLYPFWSCSAPLYQQAFRWFREKHNLDSYIEGAYPWFRYYINSYDNRWEGFKHLVYEEAELECVKKLIEIVKNK